MPVVEIYFLASFINLVVGLFLLIIIIKQRSDLLKTHTDFLTLALVSFGLTFAVGAIIYLILFLYFQREIPYGLCQYIGTLVSFIVGGNQTVHVTIAVERFLKIVGSDFRAAPFFAFGMPLFGVICILVVIIIMQFNGFHEMESKIWCFYDFTLREGLDLTGNLIVMTFIILNTLTIIACYGAIYYRINEEKKKVNEILNLKSHAVAKKFVIIAIAYFLAYAPSYVTFLYRFMSRSRIPKELEIFATFLTLCEPTITYFLLFYLNAKYRRGFRTLFPKLFKPEIDSEKAKSTAFQATRGESFRFVK